MSPSFFIWTEAKTSKTRRGPNLGGAVKPAAFDFLRCEGESMAEGKSNPAEKLECLGTYAA